MCLVTKHNSSDVTAKPHGKKSPSAAPMCAVEWTSLEVGKWLEANGLAAHKKALVNYCQMSAFSWNEVSITTIY